MTLPTGSQSSLTTKQSRQARTDAEPKSAPALYKPLHVRTLIRSEAEEGSRWFWSVNPYDGCELGCTFCSVRLDRKAFDGWRRFENEVSVKVNAVEAFLKDLEKEDVSSRQVVLGTTTEPWQPAEKTFRITHSLLEAMAELDGIDLRIHTRSSLIASDLEVLSRIARRGRVTVDFSLCSLDERITRLMEPNAPSPMRRLMALEALARAGLTVGLIVSPVLPGLDEEELGLEPLLTRAANAGAQFAGLKFLEFGPGQRENFLAHVTTAYPQAAVRFRRVVGRRPASEEDRAEVLAGLETQCARLGLQCINTQPLTRPAEPIREPSQLVLFQ
jgi:DNA repair photolyase